MKKMFGVVVVLLIFYIAFQSIYSYMSGGQTYSYNLVANDNEYNVVEKFTNEHKNKETNLIEESNYYYEISLDDKLLFSFKITGKYTGVKGFIKELKVFNDNNYTCAYPIFKGKTENIDVICNSNDKYYLYGTLKSKVPALDAFVESLKTMGYSHSSWNAVNTETKLVNNFYVYKNNISEDQNITIWSYNSFYRLTNRGENLYSLNILGQTNPILNAMVNQYLLMPDYKKSNFFKRLYITNLITSSMDPFDIDYDISYNSFIQGVVDNKLYLIDKNNKTQYAIDIYKKEVKITGDSTNSTKYYNNGKWEPKSIDEVINSNLVFTYPNTIPESLKILNPLSIGEYGGESDGYYYLYLSENNVINVYRIDKQNTNIMTLIFSVPSIKDIKYSEKDIYFISNDTLYVYHDNLGLNPLVKYNDLATNGYSLYNVYVND
jgi:hypothetical protein